MKIIVEKINKENDTITIKYNAHFAAGEECLKTNIIPLMKYSQNIESVPDSIAIIPFISYILPIIFVYDGELVLDEIDSVFAKSIIRYRKAYRRLAPQLKFRGKVIYKKSVVNNYPVDKNCSMFSAGIDAYDTLCRNDFNISECVTIRGYDLNLDEVTAWNTLYSTVKSGLDKLNKVSRVVSTNFREWMKYEVLDAKIAPFIKNNNWWGSIQHGLAVLGSAAPFAYLNGYKNIYIAASFKGGHRPINGSDPIVDKCFKVGNTTTIHDGLQFNRCEKIENIYNFIKKKNLKIKINVCWFSRTGHDCGKCEKCIRTYISCRAAGINCDDLGITTPPSRNEMISFVKNVNFNVINRYREYHDIFDFCVNKYHNDWPDELLWIKELKFPSKFQIFGRNFQQKYFPFGTFRYSFLRKVYKLFVH